MKNYNFYERLIFFFRCSALDSDGSEGGHPLMGSLSSLLTHVVPVRFFYRSCLDEVPGTT